MSVIRVIVQQLCEGLKGIRSSGGSLLPRGRVFGLRLAKLALVGQEAIAQAGRMAADVQVGVVMGSDSDWPTMVKAVEVLEEFGVSYEAKVVSAHRTPDLLMEYAGSAMERGLQCIIAGAGGAAHLPGMIAAATIVPVLGVPVRSKALSGMDSLLSIVQMPKGIPVATFAIGEAGAANAGLSAVSILANGDEELRAKLLKFRDDQRDTVLAKTLPPED